MSKKIKVMDKRPTVSDEEINSYMDFESVLNKHNDQIATRGASLLKKSVIGLSAVVVILSTVLIINLPFGEKNTAIPAKSDSVTIQKKIESKPGPEGNVAAEAQKPVGEEKTSEASSPVKKAARPAPVEIATSPAKAGEPKPSTPQYIDAEPVAGYPDLYVYFSQNLIYPAEAVRDSVQGVLTVTFIVNKEGRPEQIEVTKNTLGPAFDEEARRLIKGMPAWTPALRNGKPVASKISLPVTFQIQKFKSKD